MVRTLAARQPRMSLWSKATVTPGSPSSTAAKAVARLDRASVSRWSMGSWEPVSTTGLCRSGSMKLSTEAV